MLNDIRLMMSSSYDEFVCDVHARTAISPIFTLKSILPETSQCTYIQYLIKNEALFKFVHHRLSVEKNRRNRHVFSPFSEFFGAGGPASSVKERLLCKFLSLSDCGSKLILRQVFIKGGDINSQKCLTLRRQKSRRSRNLGKIGPIRKNCRRSPNLWAKGKHSPKKLALWHACA